MDESLAIEIRRARGLLTQQQFADLLHVNRVTIAKWEAGTHAPSLHHARQLVACGVSSESLMRAHTRENGAA